ncbi:AraC family transcriptional regulator [Paenibacillus sinopodophylli]|uniref:AraC family transcriptional regulator n=1 Tax=Paenibacillus sinopodophylli TaxID=1837342 RepID=UPI00110CA823|nr:AraC family transcriptional regulator [Paenibacillus sinopodophylli]
MNWNDHSLLWNQAFIRIIDIRRMRMTKEHTAVFYQLPSSGFLFGIRGSARIILEGEQYALKPLHLLHAGKGMRMNIQLTEQEFEYYLILYKAMLALPASRGLQKLMESCNPFGVPYHFKPQDAMYLYDIIKQMDNQWKHSEINGKLQTKGLFYLFIQELLSQLEGHQPLTAAASPVEQALRYMNEHYKEEITVHALARRWNCSPRHFTRLFRAHTGKSPIEYLMHLRTNKAEELLLHTEATLHEIAASVGYQDEYYFGRMFKKQTGLSPIAFRMHGCKQSDWPHNPFQLSEKSIVANNIDSYIGNDNYYHISREDVLHMYTSKKPPLAAVMLICLTLILTACQTGTSTNGNVAGGTSNSPTLTSEASASPNVAGDATRVVSTMKGDVTIPANPQRIVGLPVQYRELLFALGITPVAALNAHAEFPAYLSDSFKDVVKLGPGFDIPYEKILSTEPDLILGANWRIQNDYDSLTKIAPTIMLPDQSWRLNLLEMGKVLDKVDAAEKAIADYEAVAASAKEKIHSIAGDQTFMLMMVNEKQFYIIGEQNARGAVLHHDLGLKKVEAYPQEESVLEVSLEKMIEYNPDYIMLLVQSYEDSTDTKTTYDNLLKSSIWNQMTAVKKNQVFVVGTGDTSKEWHLFGEAPLANQYGIQEIVKAFENSKS